MACTLQPEGVRRQREGHAELLADADDFLHLVAVPAHVAGDIHLVHRMFAQDLFDVRRAAEDLHLVPGAVAAQEEARVLLGFLLKLEVAGDDLSPALPQVLRGQACDGADSNDEDVGHRFFSSRELPEDGHAQEHRGAPEQDEQVWHAGQRRPGRREQIEQRKDGDGGGGLRRDHRCFVEQAAVVGELCVVTQRRGGDDPGGDESSTNPDDRVQAGECSMKAVTPRVRNRCGAENEQHVRDDVDARGEARRQQGFTNGLGCLRHLGHRIAWPFGSLPFQTSPQFPENVWGHGRPRLNAGSRARRQLFVKGA
jgi:hypothetical protein